MSIRLVSAAALLIGVMTTAWACGPWFPWQVLGDRQAVLRAAPVNSFIFELGRILKQKPAEMRPPEEADYEQQQADQNSPDKNIRALAEAVDRTGRQQPFDAIAAANAGYAYRRFRLESAGLNTAQIATLAAARTASDGPTAYSDTTDLAEPDRLYLAGAVEFAAKRPQSAMTYFQQVVDLPDHARAVAAEFMVGRCKRATGDNPGAVAAFQKTRDLAKQGDPDPLDLAAASFGEQARIPLDRARGLEKTPSDTNTIAYASAMAASLRIYGKGALEGHKEDLDSVVVTLKEILSTPWTLQAGVKNPLVRNLLTAFVAARLDDQPAGGAEAIKGNSVNPPAPRSAEPEQNDRLPLPGAQVASVTELDDLLNAIKALGDPPTGGADRLAALAYRAGRYDVATHAAELGASPLASWVLAKLALRAGDMAEATRRYAEASAAFPPRLSDIHFDENGDFFHWQHEVVDSGGALDGDNRALLEGERAILALSRGEYVQALDLIYPTAPIYWGDVAYIAERVLTTDELKQFVDKSVPAPTLTADKPGTAQDQSAMRLRWLLARRLFGDQRYDDALSYFPTAGSPELAAVGIAAHDYATAMRTASGAWFPSRRAAATFTAATLARTHGMDLFGTEGPPDERLYDGDYEDGEFGDFVSKWDAKTQTGSFGPSGEASKDEAARVAANVTEPDERFHYRYVAADLAEQAAASVPPRSEAYAAIMCHAVGWAARDPTRATEIYRRYVAEGAIVSWAKHFGSDCPTPDFNDLGHARWWSVKHGLRAVSPWHSLKLAAAGSLLLAAAAAGAAGWMVRRRWRVV